jgi:hypothetical protein
LEGLEVTELNLSDVMFENDVFRCDAEYFQREILAVIQRLKSIKASPLGSFASVTDGIHTSLPFIEDGEVKVLSAKHPKDNYIDISQTETISLSFHHKNPRTALRSNDVLISTVGTIGNAGVVHAKMLPANSDRHVGIIRTNTYALDPHFLSTFLVSRFGRIQSNRETTGNVQPNLFISKICRLLIPRFSSDFESSIAGKVRDAYGAFDKSFTHINNAESLLLTALGLENWQAPEPLTYVRNSREAFSLDRLDAEFFNPKTNAIRTTLGAKGDVPLGDICAVTTGFPWRSDKFIERGTDDGVPFVRIRDCKPGGVSGGELDRLPADYVLGEKQVPARAGDVVLGMDGLKWFYASLLLDECLVNQRVALLSDFREGYSGAYVHAVVNSFIGQSQLLSQMTIAQTVGHITLEDIRGLRVPSLTEKQRAEVSAAVLDSIHAKKRAANLIDAAKRAVEIAIEDSEATAIRYLNQINDAAEAS